jgi:hypothetical protein
MIRQVSFVLQKEVNVNPTTQRLFNTSVLLMLVSVVGLVLALIFDWPAQLGGGDGSQHLTFRDAVLLGSVTSLPPFPWIALALFTFLIRSQRWWGTAAVVGLILLGALFTFGGLGEAFAPKSSTEIVPRPVLVIGGGVYVAFGLALVWYGIADLRDRMRAGQVVMA